jgi:ubiquinone/menaquinone biosynthesis C-methylase UbiE
MAQKGCTVYVTDLSPEMLKEAQQKIDKEGLSEKIHVSEGDMCNIDFPSNHFDFVLC